MICKSHNPIFHESTWANIFPRNVKMSWFSTLCSSCSVGDEIQVCEIFKSLHSVFIYRSSQLFLELGLNIVFFWMIVQLYLIHQIVNANVDANEQVTASELSCVGVMTIWSMSVGDKLNMNEIMLYVTCVQWFQLSCNVDWKHFFSAEMIASPCNPHVLIITSLAAVLGPLLHWGWDLWTVLRSGAQEL